MPNEDGPDGPSLCEEPGCTEPATELLYEMYPAGYLCLNHAIIRMGKDLAEFVELIAKDDCDYCKSYTPGTMSTFYDQGDPPECNSEAFDLEAEDPLALRWPGPTQPMVDHCKGWIPHADVLNYLDKFTKRLKVLVEKKVASRQQENHEATAK